MAKALGYAPGQQDAWSKRIDGWGTVAVTRAQNGANPERAIPDEVLDLAAQVEDAPRHLGIHSGGMVICDRPVIEVCPVEWGRMADRSVLQWDKDDCAAAGLVKFDLLGLGMLSALHYAVDLVREHRGCHHRNPLRPNANRLRHRPPRTSHDPLNGLTSPGVDAHPQKHLLTSPTNLPTEHTLLPHTFLGAPKTPRRATNTPTRTPPRRGEAPIPSHNTTWCIVLRPDNTPPCDPHLAELDPPARHSPPEIAPPSATVMTHDHAQTLGP